MVGQLCSWCPWRCAEKHLHVQPLEDLMPEHVDARRRLWPCGSLYWRIPGRTCDPKGDPHWSSLLRPAAHGEVNGGLSAMGRTSIKLYSDLICKKNNFCLKSALHSKATGEWSLPVPTLIYIRVTLVGTWFLAKVSPPQGGTTWIERKEMYSSVSWSCMQCNDTLDWDYKKRSLLSYLWYMKVLEDLNQDFLGLVTHDLKNTWPSERAVWKVSSYHVSHVFPQQGPQHRIKLQENEHECSPWETVKRNCMHVLGKNL